MRTIPGTTLQLADFPKPIFLVFACTAYEGRSLVAVQPGLTLAQGAAKYHNNIVGGTFDAYVVERVKEFTRFDDMFKIGFSPTSREWVWRQGEEWPEGV